MDKQDAYELQSGQNADIYMEETYGDYDVASMIIRNFRDELDERLDQMKVFSPFMEILRRSRSKEDRPYPVPELCMAVLTFLLYEGRLKFKGLLFHEILDFIVNSVEQLMDIQLSQEEALSLTGEILDELQNNGTSFMIRYYSFAAGHYKEKHIKLIEMKLSDEDGRLYYHITKEGLDFYLKTKEFPEESQITVNLLLFKMQLEKGAFRYAYDTVKRLNMEVQRKLERKNYILRLLMAGGKEGSTAYREYHQSISLQFQEESELFQQSRNLLQDTFEDFHNKIVHNTITEKEKRAFQMIKRIEQEMRKALASHETLLREATGFVKEYDRILELRRRTAFTERFHFSGEMERLVDKGLPPANMKFLWEPLIKPNIRKRFNPLKVFLPQNIASKEDNRDNSFEEAVEKAPVETIDQIVQARVAHNFILYASSLLRTVFEQDPDSANKDLELKTWCKLLESQYGSDSVCNGDFVSFLIALNRGKEPGSRIKRYSLRGEDFGRTADNTDGGTTMEEVLYAAAIKSKLSTDGDALEVESFEDTDIDLGCGVKVTNMKFRRIVTE